MMTNDLTELEKEYLWATECELATLESCKIRKSTPKNELKRHGEISRRMFFVCKNVIKPDISKPTFGYPLLKELLLSHISETRPRYTIEGGEDDKNL